MKDLIEELDSFDFDSEGSLLEQNDEVVDFHNEFDNHNNNISSNNLTTIAMKRSSLDLDFDDSEDNNNSNDIENVKNNNKNKLKSKKDKAKKEKTKHKSTCKHNKHKHDHSDKEFSLKVNQSHYGKYGINREENYHREFEADMTEVKDQPEILKIMKAFIDFNEIITGLFKVYSSKSLAKSEVQLKKTNSTKQYSKFLKLESSIIISDSKVHDDLPMSKPKKLHMDLFGIRQLCKQISSSYFTYEDSSYMGYFYMIGFDGIISYFYTRISGSKFKLKSRSTREVNQLAIIKEAIRSNGINDKSEVNISNFIGAWSSTFNDFVNKYVLVEIKEPQKLLKLKEHLILLLYVSYSEDIPDDLKKIQILIASFNSYLREDIENFEDIEFTYSENALHSSFIEVIRSFSSQQSDIILKKLIKYLDIKYDNGIKQFIQLVFNSYPKVNDHDIHESVYNGNHMNDNIQVIVPPASDQSSINQNNHINDNVTTNLLSDKNVSKKNISKLKFVKHNGENIKITNNLNALGVHEFHAMSSNNHYIGSTGQIIKPYHPNFISSETSAIRPINDSQRLNMESIQSNEHTIRNDNIVDNFSSRQFMNSNQLYNNENSHAFNRNSNSDFANSLLHFNINESIIPYNNKCFSNNSGNINCHQLSTDTGSITYDIDDEMSLKNLIMPFDILDENELDRY